MKKRILTIGLFLALAGVALRALTSCKGTAEPDFYEEEDEPYDALEGLWESEESTIEFKPDLTFSFTPKGEDNTCIIGQYHYDAEYGRIIFNGRENAPFKESPDTVTFYGMFLDHLPTELALVNFEYAFGRPPFPNGEIYGRYFRTH